MNDQDLGQLNNHQADLPQPPSPQPAPVGMATPPIQPLQPAPLPKKSKTGLIIGIVSGVVALLLIVAALLTYFLWYQNPNKILHDALLGALSSTKNTASTDIVIKTDEATVSAAIASHSLGGNSAANLKLTVKVKDLDHNFKLSVDSVFTKDNTAYLKVNDLNKAVDDAIDAFIQTNPATQSYSPSEVASFKGQITQSFGPMIKKIDNQWLKFTPTSLEDKDSKCLNSLLADFNTDPKLAAEAVEAYRNNRFLIIKDELPAKDGSVGFEIDLTSEQVRQKAKAFGDDFAKTELNKRLKACDVDLSDKDVMGTEELDKSTVSLKIWVNPWTHQMTGVDFLIDSQGDDTKASPRTQPMTGMDASVGSRGDNVKIEISSKLDFTKSDEVKIPGDARDVKELIEDFGKMYQPDAAYSGYEDYGDDSYLQI